MITLYPKDKVKSRCNKLNHKQKSRFCIIALYKIILFGERVQCIDIALAPSSMQKTSPNNKKQPHTIAGPKSEMECGFYLIQ